LQYGYSAYVVHIGESTAEIETEAGSNDVTESAYPLHDNPITGILLAFQ